MFRLDVSGNIASIFLKKVQKLIYLFFAVSQVFGIRLEVRIIRRGSLQSRLHGHHGVHPGRGDCRQRSV